MPARIAFTRTVVGVALLKIGIGLLAVSLALATNRDTLVPRDALHAALVSVYAAAGLFLLRGSRRDERAAFLGVTFLLVATTFADRFIAIWRASDNLALATARGVFALHVDAFMPYFLWCFARDFPRAPHTARARRRFAVVTGGTAVIGGGLLTVNFISWLASLSAAHVAASPLYLFSRYNNSGAYWIAQFVCFFGALTVVQLRATRAPRDEARRVGLLATALVAGTGPAVVWLLAWTSSSAVAEALPLRRAGWIIYPALLATPLASAYAVLVRRALDVGVVVRAAARYAFTRYAAQLALVAPLVLLAGTLYSDRHYSMTQLASTPLVLVLAALTAGGVAVARSSHGLLEHIDRRFFREHYDARRVLGELVDRCRRATTRLELERVLRAGIDRALHPEGVEVLLLDEDGGAYSSIEGHLRPLSRSTSLADVLAASHTPFDADIANQRTSIGRLPETDRHWLVDGNIRLLLALHDATERLVGIVALGEKRSELPYTREDRELLAGVVAEAEMTIAYRQMLPTAPVRRTGTVAAEADALECDGCMAVVADTAERCPHCGGPLVRAEVPLIVGGKFRVETRLGAGGMGIVYRAVDLHLGRAVAIKTLPSVSADEAAELHREARAMALVSHPNLAQIFGLETFEGRPMLIVEYLAGGTLAALLERAPLTPAAALDLGAALASGLAAVHDAGMLHGDIKPANIAFSASGVPKLLDFGLAHLPRATPAEHSFHHSASGERTLSMLGASFIAHSTRRQGVLAGTPDYMSPEVLRGEPRDVALDLWALCIVLYESICGRNPRRRSSATTAARTACALVPDLRELVPGAPEPLAAFFTRALAEDARKRPPTALALSRIIGELRAALAAGSGAGAPLLRGLGRRARRETALKTQ